VSRLSGDNGNVTLSKPKPEATSSKINSTGNEVATSKAVSGSRTKVADVSKAAQKQCVLFVILISCHYQHFVYSFVLFLLTINFLVVLMSFVCFC